MPHRYAASPTPDDHWPLRTCLTGRPDWFRWRERSRRTAKKREGCRTAPGPSWVLAYRFRLQAARSCFSSETKVRAEVSAPPTRRRAEPCKFSLDGPERVKRALVVPDASHGLPVVRRTVEVARPHDLDGDERALPVQLAQRFVSTEQPSDPASLGVHRLHVVEANHPRHQVRGTRWSAPLMEPLPQQVAFVGR